MAAIDASAASAFQFSSKLTPFDAVHFLKPCNSTFHFPSSSSYNHLSLSTRKSKLKITILASSSSLATPLNPSTKLYVSGLSFRTTQEGLRNAFQVFGQLVEVNLVMDKIANRPRGFAFLRYETEEEAKKAIEGMHGKFLDGRVIFVEVARPRPDLRKTAYQNSSAHKY